MMAIELPTDNTLIQEYVRRVAGGLSAIGNSEKQDILAEIGSHLRDRVEELKNQGARHPVEEAVAALGNPAALAAQFVAAAQQQHASRSYSPWVLMSAAARIALTGGKGMLVLFVAVIGYGAALSLLVAAILKPFIPQMGLWIGRGEFVWGVKAKGVAGHELLGPYFIPVTIAVSFLFAGGCTVLLQRLTRPKREILNRVQGQEHARAAD